MNTADAIRLFGPAFADAAKRDAAEQSQPTSYGDDATGFKKSLYAMKALLSPTSAIADTDRPLLKRSEPAQPAAPSNEMTAYAGCFEKADTFGSVIPEVRKALDGAPRVAYSRDRGGEHV